MTKRDVDSVDPASREVPEPIEIAERWREAGKILAARSPALFEETVALFEAWAVSAAEAHDARIDEVYTEC